MPLKAELDAIKKNYVKLMKLPVSDLLPALKMVTVATDIIIVYSHVMQGWSDWHLYHFSLKNYFCKIS